MTLNPSDECVTCGEKTGKRLFDAGRLFIDIGPGEIGPLCDGCHQAVLAWAERPGALPLVEAAYREGYRDGFNHADYSQTRTVFDDDGAWESSAANRLIQTVDQDPTDLEGALEKLYIAADSLIAESKRLEKFRAKGGAA